MNVSNCDADTYDKANLHSQCSTLRERYNQCDKSIRSLLREKESACKTCDQEGNLLAVTYAPSKVQCTIPQTSRVKLHLKNKQLDNAGCQPLYR